MQPLKKVLESNMKVRFHDCDPFNHLNNSKYIDYIITAREDQLREHYDFDIYRLLREQKLAWVVAQTQINYMVPAMLMEEIIIQTHLVGCTEKSLLVEAIMWNADKTIAKALMWSKLVHYDLRTQQSHSHSEALMKWFDEILDPLPAGTLFEKRAEEIKHLVRKHFPAPVNN